MAYILRGIGSKEERRRVRKGYPPLPSAHLWDGTDTKCRMWSTGGIQKKDNYRVCATPEGRQICKLCLGESSLDEPLQGALPRDPDPLIVQPAKSPGHESAWTRENLLRKLGKADALYDVSELKVFDEEDVRLLRLLLEDPNYPADPF